MQLIRSSFVVEDVIDGYKILKSLEQYGRTCYKSGYKMEKFPNLDFIRGIIERGHESVLEHEKITVRIICDRGVSHELVRHRLASYSQESTRYCNYGNDDHLTFIIQEGIMKVAIGTYDCWSSGLHTDAVNEWANAMLNAENSYLSLLKLGWRPEQARSVLPNSLKTEIVVTMNLREWRHFFKLRTAKASHPDMRALARPMLDHFKTILPVIFEDIDYE